MATRASIDPAVYECYTCSHPHADHQRGGAGPCRCSCTAFVSPCIDCGEPETEFYGLGLDGRHGTCPPHFDVTDNGTTVSFTLNTRRARLWVDANVTIDDWQWLGHKVLVVDHRYAYGLAEALAANL